MPLTPDQLPNDVAELKARLIAQDAELAAAKNGLIVTQLTIEKLKAQIARFRREKFGASSERIERAIAQLELALEEAETAKAEAIASVPPPSEPEVPSPEAQPAEAAQPEKKKRRQLPPEFARRDVVHMPAGVCKVCGGTELRTVSESVTEVMAYIPGRFEVVRHVRPACSCRKCETMVQAPMPELPIPRGMVDASFLAHIAVAKFCDHIPLYRQAEIYARSGLDIDRGLLAEWLGHVAWLIRPLVDLIAAHVMAGRVIHADDTPVPVLAPGAGKTRTGRQWVYLRDERPHGGTVPPAVLYRYTPDRKGEHCRIELARFVGWLHADGYAGFGRLYEIDGARSADTGVLQGPPRVAEVACWSHVRRGFFDVYVSNKSAIAKEALDRIGAPFDIERTIAGQPPQIRRSVRERTARPKIDELATWLDTQLQKNPRQERPRRRHPLCPLALDGAEPLSRRRASRDQQQRGREPNPASGIGKKKLVVQRLRCRRRARHGVLHDHPHRTAQRHRAGGLPARRDRPHRQPSHQPARRAAALEHAATGDAQRRRLSRPSSSGRGCSRGHTLTQQRQPLRDHRGNVRTGPRDCHRHQRGAASDGPGLRLHCAPAPNVGRLISFTLPGGPGGQTVVGGGHAAALAEQISNHLRTAHDPEVMVHIFAAAPNSLLFFLGQHHQAVAPCIVYEFDFDRRAHKTYQPSFVID